MMFSPIFDLYLIGGPKGFYIGQAKRKHTGGWKRRVTNHWEGHPVGSNVAHNLLVAGAPVQCLGSICGTPKYVSLLEARGWDHFKRIGWLPRHSRPAENWMPSPAGWKHSAEARAKISRAKKNLSSETRAKLSVTQRRVMQSPKRRQAVVARNRSPENRIKVAASLRGRTKPKEVREKISAALRGRSTGPCSPKTRAKISASNKGKIRTPEVRRRLSAAHMGQPSWTKGKPRPAETRAKISAALRGRPWSEARRRAFNEQQSRKGG